MVSALVSGSFGYAVQLRVAVWPEPVRPGYGSRSRNLQIKNYSSGGVAAVGWAGTVLLAVILTCEPCVGNAKSRMQWRASNADTLKL